MEVIVIVYLSWIVLGYFYISDRKNWNTEYQTAMNSGDIEEIADSLVYKDFWLLPFLLSSFLVTIISILVVANLFV